MKYLKVFTDFAKSIEILSDAEKGRLFYAMLTYAETGEEPSLTGSERFVWPTAKMNIDRQEQTYQNKVNAAEIARQSNPNNTPQKATDNSLIGTDISPKQNCSELKTAQDKDNDKDNDNDKDKKKESKRKLYSAEELFGYNQFLLDAVNDWLSYKSERRQSYKPTGLNNLFTTIQNYVQEYGEAAVITVIRESMSANYQGIVWDKLKNQNRQQKEKMTYTFMDAFNKQKGEDDQTGNSADPYHYPF